MNNPKRHKEALDFLLGHAVPAEEKLDGMTPSELDEFLVENGVDLAKLDAVAHDLKAKLPGRIAMAKARRERLSKASSTTPGIHRIPPTRQAIIDALVAKFGSINSIPLAARSFESMGDEEWRSLYLDVMRKGPSD